MWQEGGIVTRPYYQGQLAGSRGPSDTKYATSADDLLVEIVEIDNHPWFVGVQFHPEFTSTPRDGHPLFKGYIEAARAHHSGEAQKRATA